MIWSFSASKQFLRCQRQWYFKNFVASPQAKREPIRKEAYLLSKLDSVFAWRGKVVDKVITEYVVPPLHFDGPLNKQHVLQQGRNLFERQLAFAKADRLREPGMVVSRAGDDFAALRDIETEGKVSESLIARAWDDVETALLNLLAMEDLIEDLRTARALVAQRPLSFALDGPTSRSIAVKAFPDLISFFDDRAPLIVDWKVHAFGRVDYRLQLVCYALALTRCKPHSDFPASLSQYSPTDIDLLEVQLLTNRQRAYKLREDDVYEFEAYVAETATLMELAVSTSEDDILTPWDLPVARYPEACASCPFPKICWEDSIWKKEPAPELRQMSLF
jgi:hypothetical protein